MRFHLTALAAACLLSGTAHAALEDGPAFASPALPPQPFAAAADGTVNPVQTFTGVPGYGTITLSYGPYFNGQSASSFLSPPTSVSGAPVGSLALDTGPGATLDTSYQTVIEADPSNGGEALGGAPAVATNGFGGPVAIDFSKAVTGVILTAGFFDTVGSTTIEAFTAAGLSLGTVMNTLTGDETFNLSDSMGAGLSGLLITSNDAAGFSINGVGLAAAPPTPVPAPGAAAVLPGLLLLLRLGRKRR